MLHRLYHRLLALAASPRAPTWLFATAFAEASFFPIPPDALLIPMVLSRPRRASALAALCTAGSVAGACLGYLIGAYFFHAMAQPVLRFYGAEGALQSFHTMYARWGVWVILVKGLTPIPFKLVTIASGLARFDFGLFLLACAITRGARFFLVAGLLRWKGEPVRDFIDRRLTLVTSAAVGAALIGIVVLRFV